MNWILGILFLVGAGCWGYWRHRREGDWIKPVIVCLACTWWLASVMCPILLSIRNPVYLALAAWSFTWSPNGRSANRTIPFHPALLCFLTLIVVSTAWAVNPEDAGLRAVGLLLAFLFIWNLLRTTELIRIAVWLADGLLYASYATIVLIIVAGRSLEAVPGDKRLTLSHALVATGTAAMCLWALVRLFAEGMRQKGKRRIFHFVLATVALLAMLRTGTRGTLIELAFVLPLLVTIRLPMKNVVSLTMRYLLLSVVMLAAGVAIWASLSQETQSTYMDLFRISPNGRIDNTRSFVWDPAMDKALERPWLGRGFGSSSFYTLTDAEYRNFNSLNSAYRTTVHNQYLEVFYEFGLVGFLVFAWLLGALLQNAIRIYSYNGPQTWLWRLLAIYAIDGPLEGMTHGGQISTGELDLLQRWILYCCVLAFPLVWSPLKQRWAVLHRTARLGAGRQRQVGIPRLAQNSLAGRKAHSHARRRWSRPSAF